MLPKEAILEFANIYFKNFGVRLAFEEAEEKANKFFNFMKVIVKPVAESTNLAEEISGKESEAERNKNNVNKTHS